MVAVAGSHRTVLFMLDRPTSYPSLDLTRLHADLRAAAVVGEASELATARERARGRHWFKFYSWGEANGLGAEDLLPSSGPVLGAWIEDALEVDTVEEVAATLAAIRAVHIAEGYGDYIAALGA